MSSTVDGLYLGAGNHKFQEMMGMVSSASADFTALYDPNTLRDASIKTWKSLGAQVALLNYMSPKNTSLVNVQLETLESRMCVQKANFYAMEIILCLLLAICLLLAFFTRRHGLVPTDPSTISGLATILASSPDFSFAMKGTSNMSKEDLDRTLADKSFSSIVDAQRTRYEIEVNSGFSEEKKKLVPSILQGSRRRPKTWLPFILKPIGCTVLCALPIIFITVLMGLLAKSKRDNGIRDLPFNEARVPSGWTLLPAALLVGVGMVYRQLYSSVRGLQPFYEISDNNRIQKQGAFVKNYSGQLALQSLWHALRRQKFALLASTFAVLCAPILPIVVSGLFRYVAFPILIQSLIIVRFSMTKICYL